MKVNQLVGERFKETPSEVVIDSQIFMMRGGYIKPVASGIYSLLPPMKRITRKIEEILREEMDAIDCQEVQFPVVLPGSLWAESGRFDSVGKELLRFTDRNGNPMVLAMTHEEAAVQLVREYGQTYQKYPFIIYQIQTKFRDEARPRGGLIRVREFTMKDAYSFHTSQQDLEVFYDRCHAAYERIYRRCGLGSVVSVKSDSGMMGGSLSHEFMYLTPVGEDSIAICPHCGYRANVEAAENIVQNQEKTPALQPELVATPGQETIEDVAAFLKVPVEQTIKAVVYQKQSDDAYVLVFLRGDMEANETKITNLLGDDIYPAHIEEGGSLVAGYLGGYKLDAPGVAVLYDNSLKGTVDMVAGGNQKDCHYTGIAMDRDIPGAEYHDLSKVAAGGLCPGCGEAGIEISRGIEVGNIFQLGTKYTASMGMTYTDENAGTHHPIMGSYGIGVGRLAASLIEDHHDEYGPIWPMTVAPWQVQLCCMRADNEEVRASADELYRKMNAAGIETLYDDRAVSAGVMFSDADLFGVPIRVIASPRNLKEGVVEVSARDKSWQEKVPMDGIVPFLQEKIAAALMELNA